MPAVRQICVAAEKSPGAASWPGVGYVEKELAHVPGTGRAALGTEPAMQADILVLDHDPPGLQRVADVEILPGIGGGSVKPGAQFLFRSVLGEGDAVHRADIDAGVALDAQRPGKD